MTMGVETVKDAVGPSECWCCGRSVAGAELLHLGRHPEVGVCLNCARWLRRQADQRRDEAHPSLVGHMRSVVRRVRESVIRRGWHRRPVVGPFLRWLNRHLP